MSKETALLLTICAIGFSAWLCWQVDYAATEVAKKEWFEKGVLAGIEKEKEQKSLDETFKKRQTYREIREDWIEVKFNDSILFISNKSSPKLFIDKMNYFYTEETVYAFAPDSISFKDFYRFFLKEEPEEEPEEDKSIWERAGNKKEML